MARLLAIVLVVALRFLAPPPDTTAVDVPAPVADLADADAPDMLALVAAPALARPTSSPLAVAPATAAPPVERAPARLFRPPRARA